MFDIVREKLRMIFDVIIGKRLLLQELRMGKRR